MCNRDRDIAEVLANSPRPHTPQAEFWSDPCGCADCQTRLTRDPDGTYRVAFDPFGWGK